MELLQVIGLMAGTLTTVSFLPQVIRALRTKSTGDLSMGMISLFISGIVLWLMYGIMLGAWPIILANIATLFLTIILLVCKIRYR